MPDLGKILRLVEEGALTPAEADEILSQLASDTAQGGSSGAHATGPSAQRERAGHLRIQVTDHGRPVVNLRIPINVASFAAGVVPGLPAEEVERIREAIRSGERGPIVDITSEDGDRVLITTE
jgi:hypothetical protein